MLEVKSIIEKEMELDQNVLENRKAVDELMCLLSEFSKKNAENIRIALCGFHA